MISPSSRYKAYLIYSWFCSVSGSCVNHEKISFSRPDFVDSEIVTWTRRSPNQYTVSKRWKSAV